MRPLYKKVQLKTEALIRDTALDILKTWNRRTEQLIRMPMDGDVFDCACAEFLEMGFGQISIWSIFARGSYHKQNIHKDAANTSLIIPVLGSHGSKMQWFEDTATFEKVFNTDKKTFYLTLKSTVPPLINEFEITEPVLARVSTPHRAVAGATPRAIVSIKFIGDPDLLSIAN